MTKQKHQKGLECVIILQEIYKQCKKELESKEYRVKTKSTLEARKGIQEAPKMSQKLPQNRSKKSLTHIYDWLFHMPENTLVMVCL